MPENATSIGAVDHDWHYAEQARTAWQSAYQSRVLAEQMLELNDEAINKVRRALESVDEFVSPSLARSIQAEIIRIREIGRDYGLLPEHTVRAELDLSGTDPLPRLFAVSYREQKLYPAFLFEPSAESPNKRQVRPFVAELAKLADKHEWTESSMVHWLVSPTTWFAPGGEAPVDYLHEPAKILIAFESTAGIEW
jgi:hypothetical protein